MDSGAGQEFADHTLQPPQPMQEPRELLGLLTAGLPVLPQALQDLLLPWRSRKDPSLCGDDTRGLPGGPATQL